MKKFILTKVAEEKGVNLLGNKYLHGYFKNIVRTF